jgi:hypothetical protein
VAAAGLSFDFGLSLETAKELEVLAQPFLDRQAYILESLNGKTLSVETFFYHHD